MGSHPSESLLIPARDDTSRDLDHIIAALGQAALDAQWRTMQVEASTETFNRYCESHATVPGSELLWVAQGVQIIEGIVETESFGDLDALVRLDFRDGAFVVVSSTDPEVVRRLRNKYPDARTTEDRP